METKTRIAYYYSIAVVIALLLTSETRGDLLHMFEKALVNSKDSLSTLQDFYFNPSPSRNKHIWFCLAVKVTTNQINNPLPPDECEAAFDFGTFTSSHNLHVLSEGGTSQLSDLLASSWSTSMFYIFDPTFFIIMKALANDIYDNDDEYGDNNYWNINIELTEELEYMPCRDDAVYAMRMLLVWVRIYHNNISSTQ